MAESIQIVFIVLITNWCSTYFKVWPYFRDLHATNCRSFVCRVNRSLLIRAILTWYQTYATFISTNLFSAQVFYVALTRFCLEMTDTQHKVSSL